MKTMEKNFQKIEKNLYRGAVTIALWLVLMVIAIFLPSCASGNNEETVSEITTIEKIEVIDMLETLQYVGNGSQSISYLLLENGEVIIMGNTLGCPLPYTKQEAKMLMAFRRGEPVSLEIEVPTGK